MENVKTQNIINNIQSVAITLTFVICSIFLYHTIKQDKASRLIMDKQMVEDQIMLEKQRAVDQIMLDKQRADYTKRFNETFTK